jgi:lysophospholipid hydrolase
MSGSAQGSHTPNAAAVEVPLDLLEDEYELREAVLTCIAKSIGLVQPQSTEPTHAHDHFGGRSSFAPSVSNLSTPNSPMFPPHMAHRPKGASPSQGGQGHFGNVLDMMNASNHNDNLLGGMLREAVMKVKNDEDASSISASIQESSAFGGEKNVLRDLEGHVEVFYYKKGTALVKEGEKCPGLYYVIDGFLEVSLLFGLIPGRRGKLI